MIERKTAPRGTRDLREAAIHACMWKLIYPDTLIGAVKRFFAGYLNVGLVPQIVKDGRLDFRHTATQKSTCR